MTTVSAINMDTYSETYIVRYSEVDRFGFLKLRTLFDYAQQVAGVHAGKLQLATAQLQQHHMTWMLARMRLRISDYPVACEEVHVRTWPSGLDRLFATREYEFSRPDGAVFAYASSCWLIFDTEKMRILPAGRVLEGTGLAEQDPGVPRFFTGLDKLPIPQEEMPLLRECTVGETQIDVNHHVNNAVYADYLQDAFGPGCRPWEFQINYQKGIPPESRVQLRGRHEASGEFQLVGHVDGAAAFEIAGTW